MAMFGYNVLKYIGCSHWLGMRQVNKNFRLAILSRFQGESHGFTVSFPVSGSANAKYFGENHFDATISDQVGS